jgi:hypothetical protein
MGQVTAVDPFHDQERESFVLFDPVDPDDVGMLEPGQGQNFTAEPFACGRAGDPTFGKDLERDRTFQPGLDALIDGPHAPASDLANTTIAGHFAREPFQGGELRGG